MFKDDLKADIATFLELEEFGELITLDGVILPAQLSKHTAEKSQRLTQTFDKLHGDFSTIYFRAETYLKKRARLPNQGEWVWLNNIRYDVVSSENQAGVAKLTLSAYRQSTLRPPGILP